MAGKIPGSSLNNATIAYQSLQIPYPEFGGITESTHAIGNSLYNSLQVSVEKRLSGGLQGRVSYTWNKIMQATGYLNDQDDWSQLARVQAGEPTKVHDPQPDLHPADFRRTAKGSAQRAGRLGSQRHRALPERIAGGRAGRRVFHRHQPASWTTPPISSGSTPAP